jgi:hypothetical protein
VSGDPFPKSSQLARGERRYRRRVASPKEWAAIVAAKTGPCRVCVNVQANGHDFGVIEFHHLLARSRGGDDVAENIVPVHHVCHEAVTTRRPAAFQAVEQSLTHAEYAYLLDKIGEAGIERLFGVGV